MSFEIRDVKEVYEIRGEKINVVSPARFDIQTNQQVFDESLDNAAINKAFSIYRKNKNIISTNRIKRLRARLGLSQRDFAALMSWSPTTVATYETGSLPSEANNSRLLELESKPSSASDLLEVTGKALTERGKKSLNQHLMNNAVTDAQQFLESGINILFKSSNYTEFAGYTSFDLKKFTNMVMFFIIHVPQLSTTKLNKLMFYTDFKYFALNTISMSGVPYVRLGYGPVPDNYKLLYGAIEEAGAIKTQEKIVNDHVWEYYIANQEEVKDAFTKKEWSVLNDTLRRFSSYSAKQISEQSHTEVGWRENRTGKKISYEFATQLSTLS